MHHPNLCRHCHRAFSLCVFSVPLCPNFPLSRDISHWIRAHPNRLWPYLNFLHLQRPFLFPNKVTFRNIGGSDLSMSFLGNTSPPTIDENPALLAQSLCQARKDGWDDTENLKQKCFLAEKSIKINKRPDMCMTLLGSIFRLFLFSYFCKNIMRSVSQELLRPFYRQMIRYIDLLQTSSKHIHVWSCWWGEWGGAEREELREQLQKDTREGPCMN